MGVSPLSAGPRRCQFPFSRPEPGRGPSSDVPPLALHPSTEPGSLSPQWAAGRPWVLTWVLRPVLSVPTAPRSPGASCTHTLPCDTSPVEVTSSSPAPRASSGPSSQLHGIPRRGEGYSQIHSTMRRQRRGRAGGGGGGLAHTRSQEGHSQVHTPQLGASCVLDLSLDLSFHLRGCHCPAANLTHRRVKAVPAAAPTPGLAQDPLHTHVLQPPPHPSSSRTPFSPLS